MIKRLILLLFIALPFAAICSENHATIEEILETAHGGKATECASKIFADALYTNSGKISETAEETLVRAWAKQTMESPDVLEQVLQCPEIQSLPDDTTTITFTPITYKFSNGRNITIHYATQPKVLKQKLILASKPSLPNGDPNPELMNPDDPAKYIYTEPAWYAIMVVQHDSLSEFVGPGKNNTLSVKYINEHIDSIYPHGYFCTSKSAIANDEDTINQVVHSVVDIENDSNDYYVAGDINLEWVMYAEIAAEVVLTIATMGVGEGVMVSAKTARATRTASKLSKTVKELSKLDDVKDYVETARKISKYTDEISDLEKALKTADKTVDTAKSADRLKDLKKELETATKTAEQMEKNSKNVKNYKNAAESFSEVMKYRRELTAFRRPQTGNVVVRNLKKIVKPLRAASKSNSVLNKGAEVARAGMSSRSAKIADWLFDATLKNGARLGKFVRNTGFLYGAAVFLLDMYDHTSSTSKEFSNGIEFKPLCLLSADDLEGQENVVNYGMWLMWVGNSTDAADDGAAYLQAMDFASKFHYKLDEFQEEHGANCNVDIYVVHPIIRLDETNVNDPKGEMFYLFMNEIPWSTAEQFGAMIPNVEDWERNQSELIAQDPKYKYHKHISEEENQNNTDTIESESESNNTVSEYVTE